MRSISLAVAALLLSLGLVAHAEQPQVPASPGTPAAPEESAPAAPAGSVEVMRAVLTASVTDREPGAEITSAKVGDQVVGYTQVRSGVGETTITHRWLHEDQNLGDIPLTVQSSPWRTWSRKTVASAGNWKWQVLDSAGAVLKEVAFTVNP